MLTIVNNVIHVDLLVQEKRRVSFMYFCTHENINVFISTDRLSFPNNKISIFTGRPPISSIFNSISMLFLSKLNLLFVLVSKGCWLIWLSCWCSLMYWFPKAVDLFGFPVDALWCTSFQTLLIYLAFLLMLFGVLVSKDCWFIWLFCWCSLVY